MSQANVETVRAIYERWAEGDLRAGTDLYTDDFELVIDDQIPDAGTYLGAAGLREYMVRFLDPWDLLTIAGQSFRSSGERVLVEVRQSGTGRESGAATEMTYFQRWTFRDARVVRLESILSEEEALDSSAWI
jgi:ketosteroid isomerase-like protein